MWIENPCNGEGQWTWKVLHSCGCGHSLDGDSMDLDAMNVDAMDVDAMNVDADMNLEGGGGVWHVHRRGRGVQVWTRRPQPLPRRGTAAPSATLSAAMHRMAQNSSISACRGLPPSPGRAGSAVRW